MKKLVKFELKKIINKNSFKVLLIIIALTSFVSVSLNNNKEFKKDIKRVQNVTKVDKKAFYEIYPNAKYKLYENLLEKKKKLIRENKIKDEYKKDKNINFPNKSIKIVEFCYTLLMFLSLVIIAYSGCSVSNEFQDKNITNLICKPYKRTEILLSKLLSLFIFALLISLFLLILTFIFTIIFRGFRELNVDNIVIIHNEIKKAPYILTLIYEFFTLLIPISFILIFAFSLSTIFLNTAVSISISMFLSVGGMILFNILLDYDFNIIQYTFLPYLDFNIFLDKLNLIDFNIQNNINLNIKSACIILLINSLFLYLLANYFFTHRDIRI